MNDIADFDLDNLLFHIRNNKYNMIGSGSGRRVYDLENGYVVKAAKNNKGLAQNKTEHGIASIDTSNLFAKAPIISDDFRLLIMEKADKINDFSVILSYFNISNTRHFLRLEEIKYICNEYNLVSNDLYRTVNWGTIQGRPVIIDYGFTWKVKRKYYSPF